MRQYRVNLGIGRSDNESTMLWTDGVYNAESEQDAILQSFEEKKVKEVSIVMVYVGNEREPFSTLWGVVLRNGHLWIESRRK